MASLATVPLSSRGQKSSECVRAEKRSLRPSLCNQRSVLAQPEHKSFAAASKGTSGASRFNRMRGVSAAIFAQRGIMIRQGAYHTPRFGARIVKVSTTMPQCLPSGSMYFAHSCRRPSKRRAGSMMCRNSSEHVLNVCRGCRGGTPANAEDGASNAPSASFEPRSVPRCSLSRGGRDGM